MGADYEVLMPEGDDDIQVIDSYGHVSRIATPAMLEMFILGLQVADQSCWDRTAKRWLSQTADQRSAKMAETMRELREARVTTDKEVW